MGSRKVENVTRAQEGTWGVLEGGDTDLRYDIGPGKPKAGPCFTLPAEKKERGLTLPLFSAEFGKEKSMSLHNLSVDEVAKALENIVKGKV